MLTDDSLRGRLVLSGDGLSIGEVVRLFVDPGEWRVRAIEVKLRNDVADRIGAHHGLLRAATLQIPTEQIQSVGDAVILSVAVTALHPPSTSAATQPA